MKLRTSTAFAVLGCVVLASCYPYNENRYRKPDGNQRKTTVTSAEQQKIQQQRDEMKAKDEQKKETAEKPPETNTTNTAPANPTTPAETPKPPAEEKRDYAYANKVPGKEGFVFSPYNNKIVDVRDIPSGTLVQDPTYTGNGKGYFRVP